MLNKIFCTALLLLSFSAAVNATIVEFQTSEGNIQVNLFDQTTPKTVANFLTYLDDNYYTNSVIHRVSANFVVQGGGFEFTGEWPLTSKTANASVINEPVYSNVKGTIAMAKLSGQPNSATNQWFFNLANNASNLDVQNSGFTVFGQVIEGMDVVEKIAQLKLCTAGSLEGIPMVADEGQECTDLATPGLENFVVINQIIIIDSSEVTDADLNPTKNTLINDTDDDNQSDSGGAIIWLSLLSLALLSFRKLAVQK